MGLVTFNGNILSAMDVETTGTMPGYHEVIQVAVVPLDDDLGPLDYSPFYMNIRPEHPERAMKDAMNTHGLKILELMACPDQIQVANALEEWFRGLDTPFDRRMIALTHNGKFDIPFVKDWLGEALYHRYFTFNGRDSMELALGMNDQAAFRCRPVPFSGVGLKALCNKFGIQLDNHHDSLTDCIATAKVYKELLRFEI